MYFQYNGNFTATYSEQIVGAYFDYTVDRTAYNAIAPLASVPAIAGDIGSDTVKVQENRIAPQAETGIGESEAGRKYAVTTLSADYLREAPDFTAELGNQVLMGTPVEILGEDGYWRKVRTPDPYTAWCVDLGLKEMSADELEEYGFAKGSLACVSFSPFAVVLGLPEE